uniref:KIB1-4 beta-propeller domain-containing protein n=1 Tax=Davidia involucrata TaxID=16924 RepID=A0A5B7AQD7_DAVIN
MMFTLFLGFLIGGLTNVNLKALKHQFAKGGLKQGKKEVKTSEPQVCANHDPQQSLDLSNKNEVMTDCSKLTDDLLKLIAGRLHLIEDYVRFGGVCRSWHWVFLQKDHSSYSKLPWLMFREKENINILGFYSPFSNKVYKIHLPEIYGRRCWGSRHGWLVTIGNDVDMSLFNPLSGLQISLPPIHESPNLNKVIHSPAEFRDGFVHKAILSSSPSSLDCVVMAIYSDYQKLAFIKPGNPAWTPLECHSAPFEDIMYFNGKVFGVNLYGEVLIFNATGCHIKTIAPLQLWDELDYHGYYLVELGGEIYMVIQCVYYIVITDIPLLKTWGFLVCKLDISTEKWEEEKGLGNWSLFLGKNDLFSISVLDYPECRKNCIYFTDDHCGLYNTPVNYDTGIYNFEDHKIERYPMGYDSHSVFPPLWIRPSLWNGKPINGKRQRNCIKSVKRKRRRKESLKNIVKLACC